MEPRHQELLRQNRLKLVRSMQVNAEMLSSLFEDKIITVSMKETIKAEKTTMEQNGRLLDILVLRGPRAFRSFFRSLVESGHEELAKAVHLETYNEVMEDKAKKDEAELEQLSPASTQPTESVRLNGVNQPEREKPLPQAIPATQGNSDMSGGWNSQKPDNESEPMQTGTGPIQATDGHHSQIVKDAEMLSRELTKEFNEWMDNFCGAQSMMDQIEKLNSSEQVKSGICLMISDADEQIRDNAAYDNIEHLTNRLGFKYHDEDACMDMGSEAILRHMKWLHKKLSDASSTCDGLMIIVICRALNDLVDEVRRHELIKTCTDMFNNLPQLRDQPIIFLFQFIVKRDPSDEGVDERDANRVPSLEEETSNNSGGSSNSNCAVLYLSSYDWLEKTNFFSWVLVKAFLVSEGGASVETVLNIIRKFLLKRQSTEIQSFSLESNLQPDLSLTV